MRTPLTTCARRQNAVRGLAATGVALLAGVALAACGSSSSSHAGSASSTSSLHFPTSPSGLRRPSIVVSSGLGKRYTLVNSHYTCEGANVSPPIEWTPLAPEVLSGAKEVIVFIRTIAKGPIVNNWALAGIDPSVRKISEGQVPSGAIVGRNGFGKVGYDLCPSKNLQVAFVTIGVYAMPEKLSLQPGFDAESVRSKLESSGVAWGGLTMFGRASEKPPTSSHT